MPASKRNRSYPASLNFGTKWARDLRTTVFDRDGRACVTCGWQHGRPPTQALEVDHIVSRRNGGTHDLSNLQTLCSDCNRRKGGR